ncbi:UNVERIFIED_CONTAM: hypothetical protein RMT77_001823 [Armadillidium vulgare]
MYQNSSSNTQGPIYQNPAYSGSQSNDMGWNSPVHQPPTNQSNQYPEDPPPYDSVVFNNKMTPLDNLPRSSNTSSYNNTPSYTNTPSYNNGVNPSSYPYSYPQSSYSAYSQAYVTTHPATVQQVVVTPVVTRPPQRRTWRQYSTGQKVLHIVFLIGFLILIIVPPIIIFS